MRVKTVLRRIDRSPFVACLAVAGFLLAGCQLSAQKIEFEKGEKAAKASDFSSSLEHYGAVVKRYVKTELALRAAREAARIAYYEVKDYSKAVDYYKHVVIYSPSAADRLEAQKRIAEINFENLHNYSQAVVEFNRLLELPHSKSEGLAYRLAIARSYFYMNNFFQALVEADVVLSRDYEPRGLFDALELKANILLQTKKYDEAIAVLKEILVKYPEESKERQIGLVLSVCYEEKRDFSKAIETLDSIKETYPNKEFVEARIKSLRERQGYLPGARGWRK